MDVLKDTLEWFANNIFNEVAILIALVVLAVVRSRSQFHYKGRVMVRRLGYAALACAFGLALSACGSSSKTVKATEAEYSITFGTPTVKAGKVKIQVENIGSLVHEFVVVRGDDAAKLPTNADGSVNEDKIAATDIVGEIEDIASKSKKTNTFDLTPGKYVVFCNVVSEDKPPIIHFSKGMHTLLTVSP